MHTLDDDFLAQMGLGALAAPYRQPLLDDFHDRLQLLVGRRLSAGLTDLQLEEFERLVDRDSRAVRRWIAVNAPDYRQDPLYARLAGESADADDDWLLGEYAATRWLGIHRPDHRDVVEEVWADLCAQLRSEADALLRQTRADR